MPVDGTNLAVRAARTLADAAGVDEPVHIAIHKEIPVAGGMAGGSADARRGAGGLRRAVGPDLTASELDELAAELGATCRSRCSAAPRSAPGAAKLARCSARGPYHWVVAAQRRGLSTPAVYAEFDRLRGSSPVPDPQPRRR